MRVHLVPCGDKTARSNYVDTIEKRVASQRIRTHSTKSGLFSSLANDEYACWGVTNGKRDVNLNKWRNMNVGDICLMYREKRFFSAGKIILPFKDERLAKYLWSTKDDGSTWENMFLIDELKEISIPITNFSRLLSYKPNFVVQSYMVFPEDTSQKIIEEFDLIDWNTPFFTAGCKTQQDRKQRIQEQLSKLDQTDTKSNVSKRRIEQQMLREFHLGRLETQCSLCHQVLPNELIVAGHIWERHKIQDDQIRKDPDIVMPVCKLGCDELFEKGFIVVDQTGQIVTTDKLSKSHALRNFSKLYDGKKWLHHNVKTRRFFEERYKEI